MTSETTSSGTPVSRHQRESCAWAHLTACYLRDLPRQLDAVHAALQANDYAGVRIQAHRIKGTSGTYRLEAISHTAGRIERLAEGRNVGQIKTALDEARHLVELEVNRLGTQQLYSQDAARGHSDG